MVNDVVSALGSNRGIVQSKKEKPTTLKVIAQRSNGTRRTAIKKEQSIKKQTDKRKGDDDDLKEFAWTRRIPCQKPTTTHKVDGRRSRHKT